MLFLEKIKQKIFNKKIKTSREIEKEVDLKTIVEIPFKDNKISELIENENEKMPSFKAFQKMVTNIQFLCVNNSANKKVMLITSAETGCGKSYITANLAIAFSKIGKKVLIIDGDMQNGRQSKIFNIPNNLGLSNYLSSLDVNGVEINEFLSKFINETAIKNVNIITSGTTPPNPAELLASNKLSELIKDAKVFFDVILIDSEEVLEKKEALMLAKYANSTIIVAENKKTTIEELEKTKNEIEKNSGNILGVVLNGVKLPKVRKTKAQRKDEFIKFKLRIKEKIDNTIENIKRKINQINQKLLEEPKSEEKNYEEKIEKVEIEKIEIKKIEKNVLEEKEIQINEPKTSVLEKIKNKANEAKTIVTKIGQTEKNNSNEPQNEKENELFINEKTTVKNEIETNKTEEKIEEKSQINLKFENLKLTIKNKISVLKEVINEKIENVKNKFNDIKLKQIEKKENAEKNKTEVNLKEEHEEVKLKEELKNNKTQEKNEEVEDKVDEQIKEGTKEKIINISNKIKNTCVDKLNSLKNKKNKHQDDASLMEGLEEKDEILENQPLEKEKNEDTILVMVDAENGYCRVFSKDYFVEKLIRGVDKKVGAVKTHYSMRNLRRKRQYFIERYQLSETQTNRIDVLIYDALKDYDEYQWIEKKIPSDKAENYALAISKEYDKEFNESDKEYTARCQRLRKKELENAELNIEYKLDNLWITSKINLFDKFLLNRFAKIYEIETNMKNDIEIIRSKKNKKFYTEIIKGAEKRFEKAKKEDIKKEESEKKVVEEDRKIKQEELRYEQQQLELERKAVQERIKLEYENVRAEKKAEQDRIKEEKRKEREIERIEKKEEMARKRRERRKQKEEVKFQKERERLKQMEEAKIEEELLEDNLYPKTKHNKNL